MQRSHRKSGIKLPEKTLRTHVVFDEPVVCALNVVMSGRDIEKLNEKEIERFTTKDCRHPMWPPFMQQCKGCLLEHKHTAKLVDKKGREYKKVG